MFLMHPNRLLGFATTLSLMGLLTMPGAALAGETPADNADSALLRDYYSANGLLNRGLYELAAEEYDKFLSHHGDHAKAPIARYGRAVCQFRLGQFEEAAGLLAPLVNQDGFPFAAEVATTLGQCHLVLGRFQQAAEAFERTLGKHVEHDLADDAAVGLMEALRSQGQYTEVAAWGERFAARWPDSPLAARAQFLWASSGMESGQYEAAADRFDRLLKKYPKSELADHAALLVARCNHQRGAVEEATRQYRRVIDGADPSLVADALVGLATLMLQQGQPSEAAALLDRLLKDHSPSNLAPTAHLLRGRAWFDLGRYDQALQSFKQVGGGDTELADDAAYWTAKCKLRQGEFAEAARRFRSAQEDFADSEWLPEMMYDHAVALARSEDLTGAVKGLEEFRARFGKHTLAPAALHLLAVTEHSRHNYDTSREDCQAFLGEYPSHALVPEVRFLLAENAYLSGHYQDAVTEYRTYIKLGPAASQARMARFRLCMALYHLGEAAESEPLLAEFAQPNAKGAFRAALLAVGDICFQRSEWKRAEKYLSEYLSVGSEVAGADDALLKLGLCQQRQGRYEAALKDFARLITGYQDSPHRVQAIFEMGQALLALDRPEEAAAAFRQQLAEGGDSRFTPYSMGHLGSIALQNGDFESALSWLDKVLEDAPDRETAASALFRRGEALMSLQRYPEAEKAFGRLLSDYANDDRVAEAHAQLAIAVARQGRHDDALAMITQLEQGRDGNADITMRAALDYEKAWCLRETGNPAGAAGAYRDVLSRMDQGALFAHASLELAEIESDAKNCPAAVEVLRHLRSKQESQSEGVPPGVAEKGLYRLAACEFELDHLPEAISLFEEFLTKYPSSELGASAGYLCGEALFKAGKHERAAEHLSRIIDRYPADTVCGPALLRLGDCLAALQQWSRSEACFSEYVERFPDSEFWFQARFGIGWTCENQRRFDDAMRAYQDVVDRHQGPTAARAQFQIGECLFAKDQYPEAVRELLKVDVLYGYPEWSAAALYEAGRCFEKMSKSGEARDQFRQVTVKHGDTHWADLAAERLKALSTAPLPGR